MLFALAALIGCGGETAEPAADAEVRVVSVEVAARVGDVAEPAGWAARVVWAPPVPEPALAPGECRPAGRARAPAARGERGASGMQVRGPTAAELSWDGEQGIWSARGPRQALDPAWSVSDLAWSDGSGEHLAEGAIRFAGVPAVEQVVRAREGQVTLTWDPDSVHEASILVSGPGGVLECGVADGAVTLPWWAVPAVHGEVVLRTSRETSELVDDVLLRVRTTIERVVPLDRPAWTTAEEAPEFEAYSPHGPRRLFRKARTPVG